MNGDYAAAFVGGMQVGEDGRYLKVGATCKHAFGYSLEGSIDGRMDRHHFDAVISAQDLADTYLPPFERCVKDGKAASLMCSYNEVNGVPSCANHALMTDVTRSKWSFEGVWVSDCGAVDDVLHNHNYTAGAGATVKAVLEAGLDLNCGDFLDKHLSSAMAAGLVTAERVKQSLRRLYKLRFDLGEFDPPAGQVYNKPSKYGAAQLTAGESVAAEAARQGLVLLKNIPAGADRIKSVAAAPRGSLPLDPAGLKLVVIGAHAGNNHLLKGNYAGNTRPSATLAAELAAVFGPASVVTYSHGTPLCGSNRTGIAAAVASAAAAEAVVLTIGLDGSQLAGNVGR